MDITLILACAGKGTRAKFDKNKLLVSFDGQTVLQKTFNAFFKTGLIKHYIITASKTDFNQIRTMFPKNVKVVLGGKTRTESVKNALNEVKDGIVLIHDGARPFVNERIIKDCIDSAKKYGSGVVVFDSRNTIIENKNGKVKYLGKDNLYSVQTPQAFLVKDIKKAYSLAKDKTFNDDGEVYSKYIGDIHTVKGDAKNVKLTFKEDFDVLSQTNACRFGTGFDCHKLVSGRDLILGGIKIPHSKGLLGHSDADVLTHAIMDAILSASAMRDIGYHFPDTDKKYKGISSIKLLKQVMKIIGKENFKVKSISAVIMAEKPKLLKHIPLITENLANILKIDKSMVGIGATTLEGLGFVGREEGICVNATALLEKK